MINDINDTNSANELKLVSEYLKMIINLKPQYSEELDKFIVQIDNKLRNYNYSFTKAGLKEFIKNKREKKYTQKLNKDISIGMNIYQLELILGSPTSISEKNGYELWVYESNELNGSLKSISNYFFRNSLLIEIEHY